jgi:hypothetical protein
MAIDRNEPEVKALIEEVTAAATEALSAKNRELLGEVKTLKAKAKGADIDPAEYAALQSKVEELTEELGKTQKASKSEVEKLAKALTEKDSALMHHLGDAALTDELSKAGVAAPYMPAAKAMFKQQLVIKNDGGKYVALIGDKLLSEAIPAWTGTDEGKYFVSAPASSGGGAQGGSKGGGLAAKNASQMTAEEKASFIGEHGIGKWQEKVGADYAPRAA